VLSTLCFTGGIVLRYANVARKSSSFIFRKKIQSMLGLSLRAFTMPVCITCRNNASS
jgi:hypothetical protein